MQATPARARQVSVSTVGLVPQLRALAAAASRCQLAVSLHATTDELRDWLVPVNRRRAPVRARAGCMRRQRRQAEAMSRAPGPGVLRTGAGHTGPGHAQRTSCEPSCLDPPCACTCMCDALAGRRARLAHALALS
jgi:hypothetical protein